MITGLTVPLAVMVVTTSPRVTGAVTYWTGLDEPNHQIAPTMRNAMIATVMPMTQRWRVTQARSRFSPSGDTDRSSKGWLSGNSWVGNDEVFKSMAPEYRGSQRSCLTEVK